MGDFYCKIENKILAVSWFQYDLILTSTIEFVGGDSVKKGRRAQLDRENAHFILSEAMISTFEQVFQ